MSVDVWEVMGTVASVRIPERFAELRESAITSVRRVLNLFDETYSLYRPDSPLSRLERKEVQLSELDADIRDTYARAIEWRNRTAGAFTPHRPDGVIDLSGIVKADAIAASASVLTAVGVTEYSLNVGGDILVAGPGVWPTGIGHPTDPAAAVAGVNLTSEWCAIATSGTIDRGEHIWRRSTTVSPIISATVISRDIVASDVWATAIVSGGPEIATAAGNDGCAVYYCDSEMNYFGNAAYLDLAITNPETAQLATA